MIFFNNSLNAWGSAGFENIVKKEIQQLDARLLPLQQGLSLSSYVSHRDHNAVILKVTDDTDIIRIRAGIFYSGIIAGCSCADDPGPQDEQNEYCEIAFEINKKTAETSINLLSD